MTLRTHWINQQGLSEATGWSLRTIQHKARRGEIRSRETARRASNGKPVREYAVASLPPQIQLQLMAGKDTREAQEPVPAQAPLKPGISPLVKPAAASPLARMPASKEDCISAGDRYAIIAPLIEYLDLPVTGRASWHGFDGRPVSNSEDLASRIAKRQGISRSTVWRLYSSFRKFGANGLLKRVRSDKGRSRWFDDHPEAKDICAAAYCAPEQSKAAAHEAVVRWCGTQQIDAPSYDTVATWLDCGELPKPVIVQAREGDRALKEKMLPFLRRSYQEKPNSIWVSDHMIHDCWVRNDCFSGVELHAPLRLRFTCIIDLRSRRPVGYCWTPDGSSRSIATALRAAILRFGQCDVLYVDNGKDYKRVAKGARSAWERVDNPRLVDDIAWVKGLGVLRRLGIQVQHCLPYHPQSKHIERFFRTMHMKLDRVLPGYTTGNAYRRPAATDAMLKSHDTAMRAGNPQHSPLMRASEFMRMGVAWIESDYSQVKHSGRGMNGMSPAAVYDQGYPEIERHVPDISDLDPFFWESDERIVDSCSVRLGNRYYGAAEGDVEASAALYAAGGQRVLIHWDPNEPVPERAVITHLDGRVIARVTQQSFVPQSNAAAPMIAASMQERHRLAKATKLTVMEIRRRAQAVGFESAADVLRERAQLPMAVGGVACDRVSRKPRTDEYLVAPASAAEIAEEFLRTE